MKNPKFAIILPVYNTERYLNECVESILKQSYKNFILLAIDDGSVDRSYKILQYYQQKDKRIHLVHKDNQGVSSARNLGLDIIKRRFPDVDLLCFVDSDDLITIDFLETFAKAFKENKIDCCISNYQTFNNRKQICSSEEPEEITEIFSNSEHLNSIFSIKNEGIKLASSSRYVTNRCFKLKKVLNLRFDCSLSCGEDTLWLVDAIKLCDKSLITNKTTYLYRQRENSLSHNSHIYSELFKLFSKQEKIVITNNLINYWWENVRYSHRNKTLRENYKYFNSIKKQFRLTNISSKERKRIFLFTLGYPVLSIIFKVFDKS